MTVLVLDSPELIARAAALEAAQASKEVQAEETMEVHTDAPVSPPGQLACTRQESTVQKPREEALAFVI